MSWEAWGSGDDPIEVDALYRAGWESDPDCVVWWKAGESETTYTWDQAVQIFEEARWES